VFGADELARGALTCKALRDGSGAQTELALADLQPLAATLQSQR
jgi:histidyl-tRNA synthetase